MEMQKSSSKAKGTASTQRYLNLAEIKEDTLVLKDGTLRAVVAVSSTNFALKSEEEQNALIASYQSFLNSLDFPVQILIHSRILDIEGYLDKLRNVMAGQTNELLRIQTSEYIEYVGKLVEYANIMSKTFYVVVPYSAEMPRETFLGRLRKALNPAAAIAGHQESFERAKVKLEERVNRVVGGLGSIGLRSLVLKTEELVELLYAAYNFTTASPLHAETVKEIQLEGS